MTSAYGAESGSTTHRRTISPTGTRNPSSSSSSSSSQQPVIHPDIDPAPTHKLVFQILAVLLLVSLVLLQLLLPATHAHHPADRLRRWVPIQYHPSAVNASNHDASSALSEIKDGDGEIIRVVKWMDCIDIRALVVLVNSTLSNTRYPDLVHFHFFVPEGPDDKVSYYKLKVLFPHSNLEILGQNKVKDSIGSVISNEQAAVMNFEQLAPFLIPGVHQFLSKFIYVSPSGKVEELIRLDLGNYGIAVAEDCTEKLDRYVKPEVLSAIQRSVSKPWVSRSLDPKDTCIPELSLLVIDARKIEKSFTEAILWWREVLNLHDRINPSSPTIALALHDKFLKLSSFWLIGASTTDDITHRMIIRSDAPANVCSKINNPATVQSVTGDLWRQFLPPMALQILGVQNLSPSLATLQKHNSIATLGFYTLGVLVQEISIC